MSYFSGSRTSILRFWGVEFIGCMSTGTGFRVQGEEFTGYLGLLGFRTRGEALTAQHVGFRI